MKNKSWKVLTALSLSIFMVMSGCTANNDKPSDQPEGKITAGEYTAAAAGYGGDVTVTLTIDENGKITDGKVNATTETDKIGQVAAPEVMQAIIDGNTVEVETVSGATMTSKAIIEASKDCLKQAGVGVEEKEVVKADDEEITVDVVVVGAGLSGLSASGAALKEGANVLCVEKTSNVGGISKFFSGGPFAVESHLQKEAGGEYAAITTEELFQTLNDYSHFINYAPLTKEIIETSADTIEFLESYGLTFHVNPEAPQLAHQADGLRWRIYHWFDTFSYAPTIFPQVMY